MIPFTDADGLRNYRAGVTPARRRRWPWLVLIVGAGAALFGLVWGR